MEGHYIGIQGHAVYYETAGAGNGENVLLIHTAGTDSRIWHQVAAKLSESFSVIIIDLPGHGKSSPWDNWRRIRPSVEYYSSVVTEFILQLDLSELTVVGCSLGADVALDLATSNGSQIKKIIALEGAGKTRTFNESDILNVDQYDLARTFNFCGRKATKENMEKLFWIRTSNNRDIYVGDLLAWNQFDRREQLRRSNIPVALVRGSDDPIVTREMLEETLSLNSLFRMAEIEGLGHYPMIEDPDLLTKKIRPMVHE
ncbi:MAG: alpha/beta hydrolase [Thermoplasmataceae archaeon]